MKEIKDEDRLISKILRGELTVSNRDFESLSTANLTEMEEENFRKLAQEINETIDRNQTLRKEMKKNIDFIDNSDLYVKSNLSKIDNQIGDLKVKRDKYKYGNALSMMLAVLVILGGAMLPGMIASIFTNSLWILVSATFLGLCASGGISLMRAFKSYNKSKEIDKQIKELELAKLEIISDGIDESKTQENEIKMNIVKHIYKTREIQAREIETHKEDEFSI